MFLGMRAGRRLADQRAKDVASLDGSASATVTAQKLIDEYRTNELEADSRYKGHPIEVSGNIWKISVGPVGGAFVSLKGERQPEIRFVQCMLANPADGLGLRPEQRITIRGIGRGMMGGISLRPCKVVR